MPVKSKLRQNASRGACPLKKRRKALRRLCNRFPDGVQKQWSHVHFALGSFSDAIGRDIGPAGLHVQL
eukprot:6276536-Pyramimonas_sp.AAC.1